MLKKNEVSLYLQIQIIQDDVFVLLLKNVFQGVKHAFLAKEKTIAKNGKGLGIEHASDEDIREALHNVYTPNTNEQT